MAEPDKVKSRRRFFWINFLRGFGFLALLIAVFIFFKKNINPDYITWLEPIYGHPPLVYLIYTLSEVFFGLITPEIFMIWALNQGDTLTYIHIIFWLTLITYGAGWLAFVVGRKSRNTRWYNYLREKFLGKYESYFQEYGGFLVIVAALTPVPYSAVCMLVGAADFSAKKFALYSLFRVARFASYSAIIWEANAI